MWRARAATARRHRQANRVAPLRPGLNSAAGGGVGGEDEVQSPVVLFSPLLWGM